jgi:hypothetical protein
VGTNDVVNTTISKLDTFVSYTVPARTINSGDFVVGFVAANPPGVYPADLDQSSPSQLRSYISIDGVNFYVIDAVDPGGGGNFAIRATVTVAGH